MRNRPQSVQTHVSAPSPLTIPSNIRMRRHVLTARAVASALLLCGVSTAQGQQDTVDARVKREKSNRVPVTIAVVDSMPFRGAAAVVMRRASLVPHDVIVVHRDVADGEMLSAAVFTLLSARALSGDTASTDQVLRVPARRGPVGWRRREVPTLDRALDRIANDPRVTVAGVGPAQVATLYLPPKLLKGKLREGRASR